MNLRQERLLSRRSQLGRERFKCWNAWCSWHRQRHERGRYRCVALSLFTDPAVHHVRVQAMRQGHTTDAGPRLGTQGKYFCLELLAVFTPAWAVLIQRLFHRLHDPPSWGRCPLHAGSSRWDRRALTLYACTVPLHKPASLCRQSRRQCICHWQTAQCALDSHPLLKTSQASASICLPCWWSIRRQHLFCAWLEPPWWSTGLGTAT